MRCLHPVLRSYLDLRGERQYVSCPCNHCIACLHNEQDSWCIRLQETCNSYKEFIYDTLTISPSHMSYLDVSDIVFNPDACYSEESARLIEHYSGYDENGNFSYRVPYLAKKDVQDWIKRGRELYKRRTGKRLDFKYFIVSEYGPKWSRPHLHCLFFGIPKDIYLIYFANPWRHNFGFTKTEFISDIRGNNTDKDRECIARYVSKYVSKGVFESPLVKDFILDKPFRLISKGIGIEYLNRPVFDFFKRFDVQCLRDISVDRNFVTGDFGKVLNIRYLLDKDITEGIKFDFPLRYLTIYYDRSGFPHSLPRYYRSKLLKLDEPNIFSYKVQSLLLENSRLYRNSQIQEFALRLGYRPDPDKLSDTYAGFDKVVFDLLSRKFVIEQASKSKIEGQRRFSRLKNHYQRAMNLTEYAYIN